MGKRILVTGGCGFLGSHLCERLLNEENEVICLDNLMTSSKNNIRHLLDNHYFEFIRHDVTVPIKLEVDQIYNLACPASPIHYQKDPVKTIRTSVMGAINMLDLAKETGARILQTSTSEVYGDPIEHPQKETYWGNVNPIGIRSCYDEGKRVAETLFYDYNRNWNVDIRVVRIFNTYGPRMHPNDGRVVSNFIVQALKGEDLTIYGDGKQTRCFCYVSDTVDGLIKTMESDYIYPINIGNPDEKSIISFANIIIDLINPKLKISCKTPLPKDDPMQRMPDIDIAGKVLKWKPRVDLRIGLRLTIEYFGNKLSKGDMN